jgi:hypothetical protein
MFKGGVRGWLLREGPGLGEVRKKCENSTPNPCQKQLKDVKGREGVESPNSADIKGVRT